MPKQPVKRGAALDAAPLFFPNSTPLHDSILKRRPSATASIAAASSLAFAWPVLPIFSLPARDNRAPRYACPNQQTFKGLQLPNRYRRLT